MRAILFVLAAGCGAQPNQPVLANAPRPNPSAVAGGAAAAAAAITLASPDSARPEKQKNDDNKKPMKVKEHAPASALDHLDAGSASQPAPGSAQPQPTQTRPPKDALDFGQPAKP